MSVSIARLEAGLYRIDLPQVLTDSIHGAMTGFEIATARVFDTDGADWNKLSAIAVSRS